MPGRPRQGQVARRCRRGDQVVVCGGPAEVEAAQRNRGPTRRRGGDTVQLVWQQVVLLVLQLVLVLDLLVVQQHQLVLVLVLALLLLMLMVLPALMMMRRARVRSSFPAVSHSRRRH